MKTKYKRYLSYVFPYLCVMINEYIRLITYFKLRTYYNIYTYKIHFLNLYNDNNNITNNNKSIIDKVIIVRYGI